MSPFLQRRVCGKMPRPYAGGMEKRWQKRGGWAQAVALVVGLMLLVSLGGCTLGLEPGPVASEIYAGSFAPEPMDTWVEADSLVVVSYNIAFGRQLEEAARALQMDPDLSRADILLLQEMDPEGVEFLARALGMNYVYGPSYVHPRHGKRWGTAVLTTGRIRAHRTAILPYPNIFSSHHRRAVAADIEIRGRRVRAVSVHLSTPVTPFADRQEQVRTVADSLAAGPVPVVVAGDFNTGTDQEGLELRQLMRGAGLRQVRLPAGPTALRSGLLGRLAGELVLDHIFYRGLVPMQAGVAGQVGASDHFPVWAVLRWPE